MFVLLVAIPIPSIFGYGVSCRWREWFRVETRYLIEDFSFFFLVILDGILYEKRWTFVLLDAIPVPIVFG